MTVILVSHSMEDVARCASRLLVMNRGHLIMDGTPAEIFSRTEEMNEIGLFVPQVTYLMHVLKERGMDVGDETVLTVDRAVDISTEAVRR